MWYATSHPSHAYILEEIVARSLPQVNFYPAGWTPVCDTCQLDNARHQYVLDEIASYDQPGMAGFGFLAGRQGRKSRVKRLRPVVAKGRVFGPPAGAQAQNPGYGSGGGDAMQAVAAAEIGVQAERASRWQQPITQAPRGLEKMLSTGAVIGAGMGKEAADARNKAQQAAKQTKFLQSSAGADWAKTPAGQQWGASKPGQTWQEQQKFDWGTRQDTQQTKFLQTQAGADWARTPEGQKWGASVPGLVWQDKYYPKTEQQKKAEQAAQEAADPFNQGGGIVPRRPFVPPSTWRPSTPQQAVQQPQETERPEADPWASGDLEVGSTRPQLLPKQPSWEELEARQMMAQSDAATAADAARKAQNEALERQQALEAAQAEAKKVAYLAEREKLQREAMERYEKYGRVSGKQ